MALVAGSCELGKKLARILGLEERSVRGITLHVVCDAAGSVTVEMHVDKDELQQMVDVLEQEDLPRPTIVEAQSK